MYKGKARAYTNIALIKYWGKQDETFILPMNNSLSLTLDAFYTETTVAFSPDFTQDRFTLDGVVQTDAATKKVADFLDLVRKKRTARGMPQWKVKTSSQPLLDLPLLPVD